MSRELEFAISNSATEIRVSSTLNSTDFPIPGVILIDSEQIKYENLTDREFIGCTRGYNGTSAASHVKGADVLFYSVVPASTSTITEDSFVSINNGDSLVPAYSFLNEPTSGLYFDPALESTCIASFEVPSVAFDSTIIPGETRMLLWDVDSGDLVRVSVGAADSGGVGYKVLRIPN
jgi:hypothetical protein